MCVAAIESAGRSSGPEFGWGDGVLTGRCGGSILWIDATKQWYIRALKGLFVISALWIFCGCWESERVLERTVNGVTVRAAVDDEIGDATNPWITTLTFRQGDRTAVYENGEGLISMDVFSPDGKWILLINKLNGGFLFCESGRIIDCLENEALFSGIYARPDFGVFFYSLVEWRSPNIAVIEVHSSGSKKFSSHWAIDLELGVSRKILDGGCSTVLNVDKRATNPK